MKQKSVWTKVLSAFGLFLIGGALTSFAAEKLLTMAELKEIQRKIKTQKANCERDKCDDLKTLTQYERVIEVAIDSKAKVDLLKEENKSLKDQAEAIQKSLPLAKNKSCLKPRMLLEKMIELGIDENGSLIYSKRPQGMEAAHCWSNGKRRKEATATLCEFPLAINILTKGGKPGQLTEKRIENFFDLRACNLVSVRIIEESVKGKKETFLSLPTCMAQWRKRGADATMTKAQIETMEQTIQQCFQYKLLPADEKQLKELSAPGPDPERKS